MKSATIKGRSIEPGIKAYRTRPNYESESDLSGAKRSKSYSRIVKGATVRQSAVPSIPTRYQRILVNSKPDRSRFSK